MDSDFDYESVTERDSNDSDSYLIEETSEESEEDIFPPHRQGVFHMEKYPFISCM